MAASYSDSFQLSQDPTFQGRVQQSLVTQCTNIANEGWGVAFHRERSRFITGILSNPTSLSNYVTLFSNVVAANATVLSDATQAGTVALTTGNRATQAALVTDAHIDNAISAQIGAFVLEPGN
jgi:hypothetical protein